MKNIKTMKRVCSGIGIVLLVFLLAACNHLNNINDVSIADDGFLGSTLNLSGSMLAVFFDEENRVHIFEQLNEDMIVSSNLGGEGMFSNEHLSFTMGSPEPSLLRSIEEMFFYHEEDDNFSFFTHDLFFRNMKISVLSAGFTGLLLLETPIGEFSRQYLGETKTEIVFYVYVDKDVSITADGTTLEKWGRTVITDDLEINLRVGWNAIHYHSDWSSDDLIRSITLGDPPYMNWLIARP